VYGSRRFDQDEWHFLGRVDAPKRRTLAKPEQGYALGVLSPAQLAFLAVLAITTLTFVVAGAILGRVAVGSADLRAVSGGMSGRLPQIVVVGPVMVVGVTGIYWLSSVSLPAAALTIVALSVAGRLLETRQPRAEELRQRRSKLNAALTRHPAVVWGLRILFAGYVAALVLAAVVINPNP